MNFTLPNDFYQAHIFAFFPIKIMVDIAAIPFQTTPKQMIQVFAIPTFKMEWQRGPWKVYFLLLSACGLFKGLYFKIMVYSKYHLLFYINKINYIEYNFHFEVVIYSVDTILCYIVPLDVFFNWVSQNALQIIVLFYCCVMAISIMESCLFSFSSFTFNKQKVKLHLTQILFMYFFTKTLTFLYVVIAYN